MYSVNNNYSYFKNVNEALDWITGQMRFGVRPGLRRIELLLEKLGNPEQHLKFISYRRDEWQRIYMRLFDSHLINMRV